MDSEAKIQVRYLDRKFFRNMLRHTNVHNRMQEEQEMWRARDTECKQTRKRSHSPSSRRSKHKKSKRVQEADEYHRHANNLKRELTKCDPVNSDRWTHNGFLELYPEETNIQISTDEESEEEGKRKKKRKKHKRGKKKKKSQRKSQQTDSSESESDDSSSESDRSNKEETSKHKKATKNRKKRRKKKRHKRDKR